MKWVEMLENHILESLSCDILLTQMAMAQDVLLRLPAVRTDWPDNGPSASRLGLSQNVACSWRLRCNSDGTTLCTTLGSDNSPTPIYLCRWALVACLDVGMNTSWIMGCSALPGKSKCLSFALQRPIPFVSALHV